MQFKPLTEEQFNELQRFTVPPERARNGWKFNIPACLAALDELGITLPVRVRFIKGKYRWGTHYNYPDHHRITLAQDYMVHHANETLWHELWHAKQSEDWMRATGKDIVEFHKVYDDAKGEWGKTYLNNYYERDACENAALRKERMLLEY